MSCKPSLICKYYWCCWPWYQYDVTLYTNSHGTCIMAWNSQSNFEQYIMLASVDSPYEPDLRLTSTPSHLICQFHSNSSTDLVHSPLNLPYKIPHPPCHSFLPAPLALNTQYNQPCKYHPKMPYPIPMTVPATTFDQSEHLGTLNLILLQI